MSDVELLEFVEIDLPRCGRTYGVAPCMAAIGETGEFKCYNSPATCQDPANYLPADPLTVRFSAPSESLPLDVDSISNIKSVKTRAQEIKPAESLGTRESVTVSFQNHPHNDFGYDPYLSERPFNPYNQGTHWGKFIARWPNLQGKPLRTIHGRVGQSLEEMEVRHYFIESHSGPDIKGNFSITAKDAIKFLDGNKAQAPLPSNGRLLNDITETATTLTLDPAGIGSEYSTSGIASIGDEIVSFTRSGDVITLTGRGLRGTEQEAHEAEEVFQEALVFDSESPSDIIHHLIFGTDIQGRRYTDTPLGYADLEKWQQEVRDFYGLLLSAEIVRPTPVKDLVSELIQQVGLEFYTDVIEQKLILRVLRARTTAVTVTDDNTVAGTLQFSVDEEKRVNAVFTYYGMRNPMEKLDDDGNYRSIVAKYDDDPVMALEGLPLSIKSVRSRWIPNTSRPAAEVINNAMIDRYGDTPAVCSFQLPVTYPVRLGSQIAIGSRLFEDAQGSPLPPRSAIVTRAERSQAHYNIKAAMINFRRMPEPGSGGIERHVPIDANALNWNLHHEYAKLWQPPNPGDIIVITVGPGVMVGGDMTSPHPGAPMPWPGHTPVDDLPAIDIGEWPEGVQIVLALNGRRIQGRSGKGGYRTYYWATKGQSSIRHYGLNTLINHDPTPGGIALRTRHPITIIGGGEIWGGGGGGGASSMPDIYAYRGEQNVAFMGGSGAGYIPAQADFFWQGGDNFLSRRYYNATTEQPGKPPITIGGHGGAPGQDGKSGTGPTSTYLPIYNTTVPTPTAGAPAGAAIDGISFVTFVDPVDIRGPQIG